LARDAGGVAAAPAALGERGTGAPAAFVGPCRAGDAVRAAAPPSRHGTTDAITGDLKNNKRLPIGTRLAARSVMTDLFRFRRLIGAAAHLCQVEADLVAAGYPELVSRLDDIRTAIDLEISYLEPGDLSQAH